MTSIPMQRRRFNGWPPLQNLHPLAGLVLMALILWQAFPAFIYHIDATAALPDAGIWALLLLTIIAFLMLLWLCAYILRNSWERAGLPTFAAMVSQFNHLSSWEQCIMYWASYALLLLAAIGSLIAIF